MGERERHPLPDRMRHELEKMDRTVYDVVIEVIPSLDDQSFSDHDTSA